jgi:nucleotide-binding universal stress UspA family protein
MRRRYFLFAPSKGIATAIGCLCCIKVARQSEKPNSSRKKSKPREFDSHQETFRGIDILFAVSAQELELIMYKRILVPSDGSDLSFAAIQAAMRLANSIGAEIVAINIMPTLGQLVFPEYGAYELVSAEEFEKETADEARSILAVAEEEAASLKVQCKTVAKRDSDVFRAIIDAANEYECDLILMASHGRRGVMGLLLGSETTKVLTHSRIPVLIYR